MTVRAAGRACCSTWNTSLHGRFRNVLLALSATGTRNHSDPASPEVDRPKNAREAQFQAPHAIGAASFPDAIAIRLPDDWRCIRDAVEEVRAAASAWTDGIPSTAEEASHRPRLRDHLAIGHRPTTDRRTRSASSLAAAAHGSNRPATSPPGTRPTASRATSAVAIACPRSRDEERVRGLILGLRAIASRPTSPHDRREFTRPMRHSREVCPQVCARCVSTDVPSRPHDFTRPTRTRRGPSSGPRTMRLDPPRIAIA